MLVGTPPWKPKKKKKEETRMKEEKKKKLMFRNAVPRKEDQTCPESPFEASKKKKELK